MTPETIETCRLIETCRCRICGNCDGTGVVEFRWTQDAHGNNVRLSEPYKTEPCAWCHGRRVDSSACDVDGHCEAVPAPVPELPGSQPPWHMYIVPKLNPLRIVQQARQAVIDSSPFDRDAYLVVCAVIGHLIGRRLSSVDAVMWRNNDD